MNKSIKKSSNSKPVVKSIDLALIDLSDDDFTNQQDHNSFQKAIMTTNFTGILLEGKRKNHEVGAANKDMIPKKRGPDYSKTENLTLKVLKQSECEHGNKQNNRDPNNLSDIELNTVFGINLALQNYMNERSAIISCRSEDKKLSKPEKFQKNSQNKSNSLTKKSTKYKIRRYGAVLSKQNEKEYYYPLLPLNKSTQNAGATNTQLINIVKKSTDIVIKAKNNESHIIEKNLVCTDADPADLLVADHSSLTENNAKSICTDQLSPGNHPALLEKTERLSPTAITSQPPTHKQVILAFANAMKVVSK